MIKIWDWHGGGGKEDLVTCRFLWKISGHDPAQNITYDKKSVGFWGFLCVAVKNTRPTT